MRKRTDFIYDDLISPDGYILEIQHFKASSHIRVRVDFLKLPSSFLGFSIDPKEVFFNLKNVLAQLGVESKLLSLNLSKKRRSAEAQIELFALGQVGTTLLKHLEVGAYIGKLFAADKERLVKTPSYLSRLFGRVARLSDPLLSFGEIGKENFEIKTVDGRAVAYIPLEKGSYTYDHSISSMIPTIAKALKSPDIRLRKFIKICQKWEEKGKKYIKPNSLLLVRTKPLHIRTVFAHVVNSLLPEGFMHSSASILDHNTKESGNMYALYGNSPHSIKSIPLEFYCLHPYKENIFFSHRDQLQSCIKNPNILFKAMFSAPKPLDYKCATFVVKSSQLLCLKARDWLKQGPSKIKDKLLTEPTETLKKTQQLAQLDPSYQILKNIEEGHITSEGILLTRYFPSSFLKSHLINSRILEQLKHIYFEIPSETHGMYFSFLDRSMLIDLYRMGVSTFWLDKTSQNILQFSIKPNNEAGMFVPIEKVNAFKKSTMIGIYGSHLLHENIEHIITELLEGLLHLKYQANHPLLNRDTPLALVTGGGMGAMNIANEKAKELGILSCGQLVDFRIRRKGKIIHEEKSNPHLEAKMTYRLEQLIERQSDFRLDFPIFVKGGFGTDFELTLEQLRRNFVTISPTPVLLIGPVTYWKNKISPFFKTNLKEGTIPGFEWVSNCFYCIQNAKQGLSIYEKFANKTLPIGRKGPIYKEGLKCFKGNE